MPKPPPALTLLLRFRDVEDPEVAPRGDIQAQRIFLPSPAPGRKSPRDRAERPRLPPGARREGPKVRAQSQGVRPQARPRAQSIFKPQQRPRPEAQFTSFSSLPEGQKAPQLELSSQAEPQDENIPGAISRQPASSVSLPGGFSSDFSDFFPGSVTTAVPREQPRRTEQPQREETQRRDQRIEQPSRRQQPRRLEQVQKFKQPLKTKFVQTQQIFEPPQSFTQVQQLEQSQEIQQEQSIQDTQIFHQPFAQPARFQQPIQGHSVEQAGPGFSQNNRDFFTRFASFPSSSPSSSTSSFPSSSSISSSSTSFAVQSDQRFLGHPAANFNMADGSYTIFTIL